MENCIFCKIISGEIHAEKVFENDFVLAFKDVNPQAPTHVLVIPKKHINSLYDIKDNEYIIEMHNAVREIAKEMDPAMDKGFRLVCNTGPDGGQTVDHLHFHLLGGRKLLWPPG